jgi:predicted acylesterase/phospholipase RssA
VAGADGEVRIGLTISGAIALGAYEGGALAALLAAVQAVAEKRPGALRIDAMAGASAGSITAVLAARALVAGLDPLDVMYGAWVTAPQLEKLTNGDASPLAVDSTRAQAATLLGGNPDPKRAQATPIRVNMAIGCLRGLNYEIGRIGGPPIEASTYLDWATWTIDGSRDVGWYTAPNGPVDTALASGAHAAAFRPYPLDRSAPDVLAGYEANGIQNFLPSKFLWYTDGGTIDNEPLGRALGLTQEIDASADDPLGSACRLHLMITPDPARPVSGDDDWSRRQPPPNWARTGFRALKLLRVQRLYDDLRELEKTNSRIEWVRLLELELASIIERGGADAVAGLEEVTATIRGQRAALTSAEDLRGSDDDPDAATPLRTALRNALDAATGLSKKRDVAVAVVSPLVLPEVAAGTPPKALLAGDFLGHFGGFLDQRLRECDFGLGYRSMLTWLEGGALARHGLDDELSAVAVAASRAARDAWSTNAGRPWAEGLGDTSLKTLPRRERWKLYRIAFRSARIAFRQVRRGVA